MLSFRMVRLGRVKCCSAACVSAGWQAKMSQAPEGDPVKTLQATFADWSSLATDQLAEIFQAQVEEFSYADAPNNG